MEANSAKLMYFKFHDFIFIGEFSTANLSFGCKGVMDHVDFAQLLDGYIYSDSDYIGELSMANFIFVCKVWM